MSAAVGIIMDPVSNTQKFHINHKDDIMSIAVHPNGRIVATGEIGPKPLISIWDVDKVEPIMTFNSPLTKGIQQLAFSPSGKFLAATGMDDAHNISIFDWEPSGKKKVGIPVATSKGARSPVTALIFGPTEDKVVCCAVKEMLFATISQSAMKINRGIGC